MEISLDHQPEPRNVAKGDRWISLAVITGNPRCGWVVAVKPDGSWYSQGDCWEKHGHSAALEEALRRLKAKSHPEVD